MKKILAAALLTLSASAAFAADTVPYIAGTGGITSGHLLAAGATVGQIADGGAVSTNLPITAITYVIDGGGSAITTGIKGDLLVPYACTINSATLQADASGSIVVDVWKKAYATSSPPTVGQTITASALPTLSSAQSSQDATLTGWTTSVAANDMFRFNVNSATTVTRVTLTLKCTKT